MPAHLDEPVASAPVDALCFLVRGWVWLGPEQPNVASIEAWAGDQLLGTTATLYNRPDVAAALSLPSESRAGFELFGHHPSTKPGAPLNLRVNARLHDGTCIPLTDTTVVTIARDYRANDYGVLLDQQTTAIQREPNIFATGPSQSDPSPVLAELVRRYVGPPPRRLIDVGCGFGSYGRGLLADGYDWMGVDVDVADCAELARLGLPHRQVDGNSLPFADSSFDAALCLEVLEHIENPHPFLAEIRRVAPRQLIVSVPNCELLGYLRDHLATPWHMLESTHVNYFTRWSLGALLREFYPHVELRFHTAYPLRTVEGNPLYYHIFAVATGP
jgi:SAM-dependent methyltransferase